MVVGDITPYLIGTSESVNFFLVLLGGSVSTILLAGLGNRILKFKDMNPLLALFAFCIVWAGSMLLWTYTPSGKRWLKSMNPSGED